MTTTGRRPRAQRAVGPLTLDHPHSGSATQNDKAGEASDDHREPQHHRPRQSLLPGHGTTILSCVTGRRRGAQPQRTQPSPSEQSVRSIPQGGSNSKIPASRATLFQISDHRMPITRLIHRGLVDERSLDPLSADRPDRNANPQVSDARSPRHDIGLGPQPDQLVRRHNPPRPPTRHYAPPARWA